MAVLPKMTNSGARRRQKFPIREGIGDLVLAISAAAEHPVGRSA
jgi:hypothetical protein